MPQAPAYAPPETTPIVLTRRPRLASWDAADHPSQRALTCYLGQTVEDLREHLHSDRPWALELVVGLPPSVPLLDHHDLDNYLYPLSARLGGENLTSVQARKAHGHHSTARLGTARPVPDSATAHRIRTTASAGRPAFKQQIHDQLVDAGASPLPSHTGIAVVIGYRCGPRRNWINMWKPTIDALGPLIGEGPRPWHPRDGAIVDLALHCVVDEDLQWDVETFVEATSVAWEPTTGSAQ